MFVSIIVKTFKPGLTPEFDQNASDCQSLEYHCFAQLLQRLIHRENQTFSPEMPVVHIFALLLTQHLYLSQGTPGLRADFPLRLFPVPIFSYIPPSKAQRCLWRLYESSLLLYIVLFSLSF